MVRLTDSVQKSVVYLGKADSTDDSKITAIGTGFLVSYGDPGRTYLVTARHVIDDPTEMVDPFVVRMNTKDGRGKVDHVKPNWRWLDDKTVDLAVAQYDPPLWADWRPIPPRAFASDEKIRAKDLGPGDLAYVVGVFTPLHGKRTNRPLVHTGHIALFPEDERLPIRDWRDEDNTLECEGYLLQIQTIRGSSGSPVFVRRTLSTSLTGPSGEELQADLYGTVWLLGVWQGGWMARPSIELMEITGQYQVDPHIQLSLGMGVVVPTNKLVEILETDEVLKADRAAVKKAELSARAATAFSAPVEEPEDKGDYTATPNPRHQEDFTRLVDAAARKKPRGE